MKNLQYLLVIVMFACGCRTMVNSHPMNPEALGIEPQMNPTPAQCDKLNEQFYGALEAVLGDSLPDTVINQGPTIGWYAKDGKLKQVRGAVKFPRQLFHTRFSGKHWQEIPIPEEYYEPMHLPRGAPKEYMTCYVGHIKGKPAYLFWSDYGEVTMLVFDY